MNGQVKDTAHVVDVVRGTGHNGRVTKWAFVCTCSPDQIMCEGTTRSKAWEYANAHLRANGVTW